MGGFGALSYAARHPDRFVAAASYSGVVDAIAMSTAGIVPPSFFPSAVWGPLETDRARWEAHNPLQIAANLRSLSWLELRTGNGQQGPLDPQPRVDRIETEVGKENEAMHAKLQSLGIPHVWDYGPGTHSWGYWARGLERSLPNFMAVLATATDGGVGGTVPATLSLALGASASFGAFTPVWRRPTPEYGGHSDIHRGRSHPVGARPEQRRRRSSGQRQLLAPAGAACERDERRRNPQRPGHPQRRTRDVARLRRPGEQRCRDAELRADDRRLGRASHRVLQQVRRVHACDDHSLIARWAAPRGAAHYAACSSASSERK